MTSWLESLKQIIEPVAISVAPETLQDHSYDWWPLATKWRQQGLQPYAPDVVVSPKTAEDISRLLVWANENSVPVTPWGAGSSVTGAPLPTQGGISLDMSAMHRVIVLDETNLMVKVEAGKMGHELEHLLNERGYTLNHSPQSLDRSTVGGWISTRATGQFSSRWGGIEDLVVSFTVVLPTGEIVELPFVPRAATGPDIRHLFIGAEGTLGVVTDVTLRIFPQAPYRRLEALRFPSVEAGVEVMRQVMSAGLRPFLVRFYDPEEARHAMQDKSFNTCVMFLGVEGVEVVAQAEYTTVMEICTDHGGELLGPAPVEAWMKRRFDFSTVENLLASPGGYAETIEVAHFWDRILPLYSAMKDALAPLADEVLGHFSHVYTHGTSLYLILLGNAEDDKQAQARIEQFWDVSMRICLEHDAALSHHHGVGLARQPYIRDTLKDNMLLLERLKQGMDPNGILNPGKLGL